MIVLYALFALFAFVTVILPFYLMWLVVGLLNPASRESVRIINSLIGHFFRMLISLGGKIVIAFAIAIAWIEFLKWIIIDVLVVHFPP